MQIKLMPDDVIVAVKEYMLRRGLPNDVELEVFVRGGRRGNSGTAEVTIVPKVGAEIPAPKIYENVFVPVEPVEDMTPVAEDHSDTEAEYENTYSQMEKDLDKFDKPELKVMITGTVTDPVVDPVDEEDEEVFSEPVITGKKTLGSMFGGNSITDDAKPAPAKKSANPFK